MIATVTKFMRFAFEVNGVTHYNFQLESVWQGMHKLSNDKGFDIITDCDPAKHGKCNIVKCSAEMLIGRETTVEDAEDAEQESMPQAGQLYVNNKTGHVYRVVLVTNIGVGAKMPIQVAYTLEGANYSRPLEEFLEKFTRKIPV